MIKISKYLKQKGQGIVEYALLLAFVVGIAVALQGVGLKDAVVGVFDNVATVLAAGRERDNKYLAAFKKWGTMSYNDLQNESQAARIAADMEGLTNIANYFNSLDMSYEAVAGNNENNDSYLGERWTNRTNLGNNPDQNKEGSVVFYYWGTGDNEASLSNTNRIGATEWMKQNYDVAYDYKTDNNARGGNSQTSRSFFSNEMNQTVNNGSGEKQVKVAFTTDSSNNITGTKVWVYDNASKTTLTATDENSVSTVYSVYVPKN